MGGADKVKAMAAEAAKTGDYAWAASLLNHVVMADDGDAAAKTQLAAAYEQLGYQTENAIWRNMYLTATDELRGGVRKLPASMAPLDMLQGLSSQMIFDVLAIRLNADKVGDAHLTLAFVFPERNERFVVEVRNRVLVAQPGAVPKRLTQPSRWRDRCSWIRCSGGHLSCRGSRPERSGLRAIAPPLGGWRVV